MRARPTGRYDEVAQASAAVVIECYSTSFGWATRLLAEPVRTHVRCIYALVRVADELVDDVDLAWDREQRAALLDAMEEDTRRALEIGGSPNLVVHAFARTAAEHRIGWDLVGPFFDSMRADLDVAVHDPGSFATYVYGSAEVVGLMCLRVFVGGDQARYEQLTPGARALGAAFQKINFLRDMADDHGQRGRDYFPGVDPGRFDDARRDALLDDIDADLAAAAAVIPELPPSSRRAVRAAHDLFAALSERLRRTPAAEIATRRVRVPDPVKAVVLARCLVGRR